MVQKHKSKKNSKKTVKFVVPNSICNFSKRYFSTHPDTESFTKDTPNEKYARRYFALPTNCSVNFIASLIVGNKFDHNLDVFVTTF